MKYLLNGVLTAILFYSTVIAANELRDPTRPALPGEVETATVSHGLSAIIYASDRQLAVIDGRLVRAGEIINGNQVINITPDSVQLQGKTGMITLFLPSSIRHAEK